jgi:hypothetical protein
LNVLWHGTVGQVEIFVVCAEAIQTHVLCVRGWHATNVKRRTDTMPQQRISASSGLASPLKKDDALQRQRSALKNRAITKRINNKR